MMNLRKLLVVLISCVFGEDSLPQLIINEANGYVIRQIKLATIQDHPLKIPYTVSLTKNIPTGVNVHAECNAKNMARGFWYFACMIIKFLNCYHLTDSKTSWITEAMRSLKSHKTISFTSKQTTSYASLKTVHMFYLTCWWFWAISRTSNRGHPWSKIETKTRRYDKWRLGFFKSFVENKSWRDSPTIRKRFWLQKFLEQLPACVEGL